MYDDDVQAPLGIGATDRYYKVAKFPTRNIKTPILLVYGGSDSLVDIRVMLKELPRHTVAKEVPHFEHLDFLWGQEVEALVFPHVFEALQLYAGRDHLKSFPRTVRRDTIQNGEYSSDDLSSSITAGETGLPTPAAASTFTDTSEYGSPEMPINPRLVGLNSPDSNVKHKRDSSRSSVHSLDGIKRFGKRGISLGAGKATVGGVSSSDNETSP